MREVVVEKSVKFDGQILPQSRDGKEVQQNQRERPDRNVRKVISIDAGRISFRDLAIFAFPHKTESHLAHITGVDPRTCRRWLAGNNEPPAEALGVVLAEIMKRFHQR